MHELVTDKKNVIKKRIWKERKNITHFLEIRTDYDYTALMAAARNGHENIVKTLVEKGAKVDVKGNEGMSALIMAAQYGHYEIVKFLIPRVANINDKATVVTVKKGKSTESGNAYTALHWATNGNYTTIGE